MSKRHSNRLVELSREILDQAENGLPVDSVMRKYFREKDGLSRNMAHQVRRKVFQFLRWKGCLKNQDPTSRNFEEIEELARLFESAPEDFPEDRLRSIVPSWIQDYMDVPREWLIQIQKEPLLWIRCRNLGSPYLEGIEHISATEALEFEPHVPGWLRSAVQEWPEIRLFTGFEDLFRTEAFHHGDLEIQDISSQVVSRLASPSPGQKWWDTCCGEGGKTLHLCQLIENRGLVMATDRAGWRLANLKKRAARAGVFNYQTQRWNGLEEKNPNRAGHYDGILIDAPCTGIGTWQKNPDGRWRTTPKMIGEMHETQLALLKRTWKSLKRGGRMIYAVCTMTKAETTDVAEAFASDTIDAVPTPFGAVQESSVTLWPQTAQCNGMFVAQWTRQAVS